ncbi:hypothetical protein PIB30_086947 [Stylosanthes scabra]|uniref:Uncharacterized protein n=1 Tax=Stylosanthes scabra TaxID=79078 RepID=A0ABU6VSF0_9FABA|nr:hypothetical protein [Stylosanthes scabra]
MKAWQIGTQLDIQCDDEDTTLELLRREIKGQNRREELEVKTRTRQRKKLVKSQRIRGKGKVGCIKEMVIKYRPWFLGLVETKSSSITVNKVKRMWDAGDFDWEKVDSSEKAGEGSYVYGIRKCLQ